ncbi:hypothetical protein NSK_003161 [Nannochloropsis salina CCMP1776]|uniref:Uncharacterized protein n=1 Tax=Nannochloropsis salina CCMP1776 TaxID=1027361 RepID=A0A4D9D6L9_9STRA|nr:hypothetical protein NSK_003161 [Nannochloropsis salina CCMP1776]|eukprot:TFJ85653.1 hypothetical protein NSK_003161 [Nannochloropsis salina CCMP1776]
MAKTMSNPWILPAVKAALGGKDTGGLTRASSSMSEGFQDLRPKLVQVIRGSSRHKYLEVSDKESRLAAFITPDAHLAFKKAMPQISLAGLGTCIIKLERWLVSYQPLAFDSATGPCLAHELHGEDVFSFAPLCLQVSQFSVVATERGQSTYGAPHSVNDRPEIKSLYRELDTNALMMLLARHQGLPRLPDSSGNDVLPEPIGNKRPVTMEEVEYMLRCEEGKREERIAGASGIIAEEAKAMGGPASHVAGTVRGEEHRPQPEGQRPRCLGSSLPQRAQEDDHLAPTSMRQALESSAGQARLRGRDGEGVGGKAMAVGPLRGVEEVRSPREQDKNVLHEEQIAKRGGNGGMSQGEGEMASQFGASPLRNFETQDMEEEEEEEEEEEPLPPLVQAIRVSPTRSTRRGTAEDTPTSRKRAREEHPGQGEGQGAEAPTKGEERRASRSNMDAGQGLPQSEEPPGAGGTGKEGGEASLWRVERDKTEGHRGAIQAGTPSKTNDLRALGAPPPPRTYPSRHLSAEAVAIELQTQIFSQTQVEFTQVEVPEEGEGRDINAEDVLRRYSPPVSPDASDRKRRAASGSLAVEGRLSLSSPRARAATTPPAFRGSYASGREAGAKSDKREEQGNLLAAARPFGGRSTVWGLLGFLKAGDPPAAGKSRRTLQGARGSLGGGDAGKR